MPLDDDPDHLLIIRPPHYTEGRHPLHETTEVIIAWGLDFCLGNCVKYISRAGRKGDKLEDLKKARWYLDRAIREMQPS